MTEPVNDVEQHDPDGDPALLNPRDTLEDEPYEGDPDADPGNLNPRDDT
jgi:hypothetical protein